MPGSQIPGTIIWQGTPGDDVLVGRTGGLFGDWHDTIVGLGGHDEIHGGGDRGRSVCVVVCAGKRPNRICLGSGA